MLRLNVVNVEVLVGWFLTMLVNILLDLRLTDYTDTGAEIATRPDGLAPIALLQVRKLILQFTRGRPLQILGYFGWTQLRRTRHQQVNVVHADVPLQNVDVSAHTDLPDDLARALGDVCSQHLVPVFCNPHQVVLNIIGGVRSFAILWHSSL